MFLSFHFLILQRANGTSLSNTPRQVKGFFSRLGVGQCWRDNLWITSLRYVPFGRPSFGCQLMLSGIERKRKRSVSNLIFVFLVNAHSLSVDLKDEPDERE